MRRKLLGTIASVSLAVGGVWLAVGTSQAAAQGPCDIYAAGGTPCVAAHSTTRALYGAYSGPLYQVQRASDSTTLNISPLTAGGVANAAAQDTFCAGTDCYITIIYDQSGRGNNLTQAPAGGAAGGPDNLAYATAAPTLLGGQKVYGVFVAPGTGYRDDNTSGIATGDNPEGEYAIFDGTHYDAGCCFDYGNAEVSNTNTGNGHMEAINFGNEKDWGYGAGTGPWIMADIENGLYSGQNAGYNSGDPTTNYRFTTAIVKGTANLWAIRGGNAQSGSLSTFYSGARPSGYNPMHKEGAILLGIGGDNSKSSAGTFYEGVMTSGYPSDATENSVQANITAAGYAAPAPVGPAPGSRISLQATTSCCTGDYIKHDDSDTKVVLSSITSSSSSTDMADATWVVHPGLADSSCISFESANDTGQYLRHYNFELYLESSDGTSQFAQDATFCPRAGNSGQGISFAALNFPNKFIRHYNYTAYVAGDGGSNAWDTSSQWAADTSWTLASPWAGAATGQITGYGGLCVDDSASSTTDGNPVILWTCNSGSNQQWTVGSGGTLQTLGKCMDITGGSTTDGTKIDLYTCNGGGNQVWWLQSNGELVNPQSGKCLDDSAAGGSGTQLILYHCTDAANQQWTLP